MNRIIGCHGNYAFYVADIRFLSHSFGSNEQYGISEKMSWDERLDSGVNPLPRHEDIVDLSIFGLNLTVFPLQ